MKDSPVAVGRGDPVELLRVWACFRVADSPTVLPRPQAMPPQTMPPQGMPPQTMPPQGMPPQGMPPQGMPPQTMPPQGMPPQTMPPQGMPPHGMPHTTMPPHSVPDAVSRLHAEPLIERRRQKCVAQLRVEKLWFRACYLLAACLSHCLFG